MSIHAVSLVLLVPSHTLNHVAYIKCSLLESHATMIPSCQILAFRKNAPLRSIRLSMSSQLQVNKLCGSVSKEDKFVIYSQSQSGMLLLRRNKSAWHDTEVYQALMPGYSPASMLKKCSAHWTSVSCFQVSSCVWCAIDPISICFCTLITCKTSCYRSSLSMLSSPQLCNDRDSTTALSDNGPPELWHCKPTFSNLRALQVLWVSLSQAQCHDSLHQFSFAPIAAGFPHRSSLGHSCKLDILASPFATI